MKWTTFCCAVALIVSSVVLNPQVLPADSSEWGPVDLGLRIGIWMARPGIGEHHHQQVHLAIENVGDADVVLNLGHMLANGKVMFPTAVRLLLTDRQGTRRELEYFDRRYPGVAGRVDDFLVALRAGSVYTLRLALDNYWSPATTEFELRLSGEYRIEARFEGGGARSINGDTAGIALLNFWKGVLRSNSMVVTFP